MSKENSCAYCWHPFHGVAAKVGFATALADVKDRQRDGICSFQLSETRKCGCTVNVQWFSIPVSSASEGERLAALIRRAGYDVYEFNSGDIVVQPIDAEEQKLGDRLMVSVFSETLPPVASLAEFKERIGPEAFPNV
jgi:hypothetical protein